MERAKGTGSIMAKFTYMVTVTVPDEPMQVSEYTDYEDVFIDGFDEATDQSLCSPFALAKIVMASRLGYDEDYGFDYTVDYEAVG